MLDNQLILEVGRFLNQRATQPCTTSTTVLSKNITALEFNVITMKARVGFTLVEVYFGFIGFIIIEGIS